MPKTVILGSRAHARRQAGRRPVLADATELGGIAIERRARARRRRARAGPARGDGPGAPGRPGPDPLAPGADQGRASRRRSPRRRSTRSARRASAPSACSTRRSAPATSRSASAAAWSRCRSAPYLLPERALRLPHGRRQGARRDGPRRPHQPVHAASRCSQEATEVGDELEITRADMDRWALRSHERAIAATDEGRLPEEIVAVTVKGRKGDTVVEVDEAPAPRHVARDARQAAPACTARRARTPPATRPASTTARGALVLASDEWAERERQGGRSPTIVAQAAVADDFAYLARTPAQRGREGAREGRPAAAATSTCGRSTRRSRR